jgi:hypothetical protein
MDRQNNPPRTRAKPSSDSRRPGEPKAPRSRREAVAQRCSGAWVTPGNGTRPGAGRNLRALGLHVQRSAPVRGGGTTASGARRWPACTAVKGLISRQVRRAQSLFGTRCLDVGPPLHPSLSVPAVRPPPVTSNQGARPAWSRSSLPCQRRISRHSKATPEDAGVGDGSRARHF